MLGLIDDQKRRALQLDVTWIAKEGDQIFDEFKIVGDVPLDVEKREAGVAD